MMDGRRQFYAAFSRGRLNAVINNCIPMLLRRIGNKYFSMRQYPKVVQGTASFITAFFITDKEYK